MATENHQTCALCNKAVDDVEPAKIRGRDVKIMVCPKCLGPDNFPNKVKVQWGSAYFQYYWDLGKSVYPVIPLVVTARSRARHQYVLNLTSNQVALLRMAGYTLSTEIPEEQYEHQADQSQDGIGEEDQAHSCI